MRKVSNASARECASLCQWGQVPHVRTHARSQLPPHVRTYVRTCESTYVHVRTYVRTNFTRGASCAESRMYVRTYVRTCVCTYVRNTSRGTCLRRFCHRIGSGTVSARQGEGVPSPGDSGSARRQRRIRFALPKNRACVCVFLLCMQGNSRRFGHVRTYVLRNLMSRPHRPPSWRARPWQRTCADHSAAAFHQRFTTMNVSYVPA